MKRNVYISLFVLMGIVVSPVYAAEFDKDEKRQRDTDRIALSLQLDVINKVGALAKKHKGTPQEPLLLEQLREAQSQAASAEFRLAHFDAQKSNKPADLTKYHKRIADVIESASLLVVGYPKEEGVERAYFARAEAYAELKKEGLAKVDYDFVADNFPGTSFAVRANLVLAKYAADANDHKKAIVYLKRVEAMPDDQHFPFAIYQLAWANYNLGDLNTGLWYLKTYIDYYERKAIFSLDGKLPVSDQAFFDHGLRDVVTFYFDGLEKNKPDYALTNALSTFRKYQAGPGLGKMLVSFAKLLRSRDRAEELKEWKNQLMTEETKRPETLDVVIVNFEYLMMRDGYKKTMPDTGDFIGIDIRTERASRKWDSYASAQSILLSTAGQVQKAIIATKDKDEASRLQLHLKALFQTFIAITDVWDPKLNQVHYNMAETHFAIGEYEESIKEYQWVLANWKGDAKLVKSEVRLKILSSRYHTLSQKGGIPKDLALAKIEGDDTPNYDMFSDLAGNWIRWIDADVKEFGRHSPALESFEFDANRMLYARGQTKAALTRLTKFVKETPESKVAPAAASLVLDTYVHNEQWPTARDVADQFRSYSKLGDATFRTNLEKLSDASSFKLIEIPYAAKEYQKVLEMAVTYLTKSTTKGHAPDALYLASHSANKLGDTEKASQFLSQLLKEYPGSDHKAFALRARADISERQYDFDAAGKDYAALLALPSKTDRSEGIKRSWFANWLSRAPKQLDCRAHAETKLIGDCEKYQALIALALGQPPFNDAEIVKKATKGFEVNRPIWSAVGLKLGKTNFLHQQWTMAGILASGWKDLDPLIQFTLIPVLNQVVPEVYVKGRKAIPGLAKLSTTPESLTRRIDLIRMAEASAAKASEAPWRIVNSVAVNSVAQTYLDFCTELQKVPPPAELSDEERIQYHKTVQEIVGPFQERGETLREQGRELASTIPSGSRESMDLRTMDKYSLDGSKWTTLVPKAGAKPLDNLPAYWAEAFKTKNWPRLGYFYLELKEQSKLPEVTLALMKTITLHAAGAETEALLDWLAIQANLEELYDKRKQKQEDK